jgi:hypothetical protein
MVGCRAQWPWPLRERERATIRKGDREPGATLIGYCYCGVAVSIGNEYIAA